MLGRIADGFPRSGRCRHSPCFARRSNCAPARRLTACIRRPACLSLRDLQGHRIRMEVGEGAAERMLDRSEEHTSELQSLMRISYAVLCLKKKKEQQPQARLNKTYVIT